MATAILIGLWITDESSFNHYYVNHKKLAQVMITQAYKENIYTGSTIAMPIGNALQSQFGDLFKYVSLASYPYERIVSVGEKKIAAKGFWVQQAFPKMFSFEILYGDVNALKDPSTIMVARSLAINGYSERKRRSIKPFSWIIKEYESGRGIQGCSGKYKFRRIGTAVTVDGSE
jgi:hypothetical protein